MATQTHPDADTRFAPVAIDKIHLNPTDTDRILSDPEAIEELTASVRAHGVLQPVGLATLKDAPKGKPYRVVWGRRRIAAATEAGLTEILARVKTYDTEADLLAARETENLQRRDLNPIEEAAAVARMVDLERGDDATDRKAIVGVVAMRLGKSPQWVRDRMFLAELEGEARDLVLAGRLPLTHAREIAKLADPRMRADIADQAAADEVGGQPMDLATLRARVAQNLYSLHQVPWKLDVAFADCPACDGCPSNSASRPGLFDHYSGFAKNLQEAGPSRWAKATGSSAPEAGVCTNRACFERKTTATKRAVTLAAKRAVKTMTEAGKTSLAPAMIEAPAHVDAKAVMKVARDKAKETGKAAPAAKSRVQAAAPFDYAADWKWREAVEKRNKGVIAAIAAKAEAKPGLATLILLVTDLPEVRKAGQYGPSAAKAPKAPAFAQAMALLEQDPLAAIVTAESKMGADAVIGDALRPWGADQPVLHAVAERLGVELPPMPKLEEFQTKKAEPAKPEAPAKAGRKPAKKKAAKKATKKAAKRNGIRP